MLRRRAQSLRILATIVLALFAVVVGYAAIEGFRSKVKIRPESIQPREGLAYVAVVEKSPRWPLVIATDGFDAEKASRALLEENGVRLGPAHTMLATIAMLGGGRYSHWGPNIYFSSLDGSDPRINGKRYRLYLRSVLPPGRAVGLLAAVLAATMLVWLVPLLERLKRVVALEQGRRAAIGLLVWVVLGTSACLVTAYLPTLVVGALLWIAFGVVAVSVLCAIAQISRIWSLSRNSPDRTAWLLNCALTASSVATTLAALELYLGFTDNSAAVTQAESVASMPPSGEAGNDTKSGMGVIRVGRAEIALPQDLLEMMVRRNSLLTLPKEWEVTRVSVPNTSFSFTWHGVLHIHDEDGFRRYIGPYPERKPGTLRVMIVGDSMTYGDGVEAEWTYGAQLQRLLEKQYRVEVISLGADGRQSEDILHNVEKMLPVVRPDVVIYGVCLNDFLPSGIGQYYKGIVPLPKWFKTMVESRTRLASLIADGYAATRMLLGMSVDFYDDILKDFDGYQQRFGRDAAGLSSYVRSAGLPRVIGIVIEPNVDYDGRGHQISRIAEDLMRKADFDVISLEDFFKTYDGQFFRVSRWEAHANEEAYAIFAAMLGNHLMEMPLLQEYRLTANPAPAAPSTAGTPD